MANRRRRPAASRVTRELQELRYAGNDYLTRERSADREIEHALERECGRDYIPERQRDRGDDFGR